MEEVLLDRAKKLRKEVYRLDETMKKDFPKKLQNPSLDEVIDHCEKVADVVEQNPNLKIRNHINKRLNYLREGIEDTENALAQSHDAQARVGYKAVDAPFLIIKHILEFQKTELLQQLQ